MPSKDDKSKVPAVAEPKQPSPASSWAAGAPPTAAPPAEPAPPATPAGKKPGLAGGTPVNKTPGGGGGAAAGTAGLDPLMLAALSSMLDEKLAKQAAGFNQQLGALKERVDIAEAIAESRESGRSSGDERSGDDGDDDSEEYDDDDDRLSVLDDDEYFLALDVKANKHFGVAGLANAGEFKPHRHDLYGHKPWMVLTKGGNDAGGSLAFALSYAEPLSLYGKGLADKLDRMAEAFAAGDYDPHEFLEDLVAARNTARENYALANRMRSIVVQKARAQRPGATVYDKAEVKYLERVLDERDYATADTADEIAQLRKGFAKRSNRAELDRLSKSAAGGGGYAGGGGGGGYASDDVPSDDEGSSRGKSRSKARRDKAKERKRGERERGGERPGRGGGRDTGRGNGRGESERARREQGSGAADAPREREREAQRSKAGRRDDGAGAKREGRRGQPGGGAGDGGGRRGERPPHAARGGGGASDDAGSDGEAGFE